MIPDIDIYRSAKLLIDQHGDEAAIFTGIQADECLEKGDLDYFGRAGLACLRFMSHLRSLRLLRCAGNPLLCNPDDVFHRR
jgi:hypothetical protein